MRRGLKRLWRGGERGQAAVETALVAPTTIFIILGILQLTMMQQARLMTEYAAFNAARAGSVWNMEPDRMMKAAIISLMPTRPTGLTLPDNGLPVQSRDWNKSHVFSPNGNPGDSSAAADLLTLGINAERINVANKLLFNFIDIEVLNPKKADFGGKKELEFDKVGPGFGLAGQRQATQLTLRLTYLYEMRIPFANWVMFQSYLASKAGLGLHGLGIGGYSLKKGWAKLLDEESSGASRIALSAAMADTSSAGYNGIDRAKLMLLVAQSARGRYYVPLVTTYTIRMQSNPFQKWARP